MSRYSLAVLILITFMLPTSRLAEAANAFGLGQKPIPTKFLASNSLDSIHSIALLEVPDPAYYYFGEGSGGVFHVRDYWNDRRGASHGPGLS